MEDPIEEAAVRAAEGNDGWPVPASTWEIPASAQIVLDDAQLGHLLAGATITHWSQD